MFLSRCSVVWSRSLSLSKSSPPLTRRCPLSLRCPHSTHSQVTSSHIQARCYAKAPPTSSLQQRTLFQRVQLYIRDNPYTKFSLTVCAIVLGLSIAVEMGKKYKRKRPPNIVGSLPAVGHFTVQRSSEVARIDDKVKSVHRSGGFPFVCVTGPPGVGKSELALQYVKAFTESCYKWFGLKPVKPVVLFINGRTKTTFDLSLKEAGLSLGLRDGDFDTEQSVLSLIHSRLVESKLPWLVVVDGLEDELNSELMKDLASLPLSHDQSAAGAVVITTTSSHVPEENRVAIGENLSHEDGLQLLTKLSKTELKEEEGGEIMKELHGRPLLLALAASTMAVYKTFLEREGDSNSPAARYMEVLKQSLADSMKLEDAVLHLYVEAATTDTRFKHTFDLLGSCDLRYPIPSSLIGQHLTSQFYSITKEELAPPPDDQVAKFQELTGANQPEDASMIALAKAVLPFLGKKPPSQEQLAEIVEAADDMLYFIRQCPLLAFKKFNSGFEYVQVHDLAHRWLPSLFLEHTAPAMDKARLAEEEVKFERGAWFRQLRKFDPSKALEQYHHTLPGLSAPGVMTADQFKKSPTLDLGSLSVGSRLPPPSAELSYSEYKHLISHHHRVMSTLHSELKASGGEYGDVQLKKYLQPHLLALQHHPVISATDRLLCEQAMVVTDASTMAISPENYQELVSRYEDIIGRLRKLFGGGSQVVARTMTDLADFKYSNHDVDGAHELLLTSLAILEKVSSRYADEEFKFDIGMTYASLAYVYDDRGDKKRCKDLLERALAAYQTLPKDGQVSKRQRRLVASSLTNLAHAYLCLGDIVMAKKYADLASVAHQNTYTQAHTESVRTMNISSNIYALMGDKAESIKQRTEAGKIKAKLDSKPLLV